MTSAYVELQCASYFSFLQGCSSPDELFTRAQELGLAALAIADRNTLAGMTYRSARERLWRRCGGWPRPMPSNPL